MSIPSKDLSISIHPKTLHHEPFAGRNGRGGGRYITSHTNKPSECVWGGGGTKCN